MSLQNAFLFVHSNACKIFNALSKYVVCVLIVFDRSDHKGLFREVVQKKTRQRFINVSMIFKRHDILWVSKRGFILIITFFHRQFSMNRNVKKEMQLF